MPASTSVTDRRCYYDQVKPLLLLCASLLAAQTFEVASVKRAAPQTGTGSRITGAVPQRDPGRVNYPSVDLKSIVAIAWHIDRDLITGPQWMDDERYDIVATFPAGATQSQVPQMLQHLLAERFHMTVHEETRSRTGLALLASKSGAKLTKAKETSRPGYESSEDKVTFGKLTMSGFARLLSRFTGRPVIDETGIAGEYDITLNASMEAMSSGVVSPPIQDLGLRLESRIVSAKFLIVDKADKVPTGN
jgi:uncharacterized protein (TIGR03435 family)